MLTWLQQDLEQALISVAAQLKQETKRRLSAQREFRHMQRRRGVEQKLEHVRSEHAQVVKVHTTVLCSRSEMYLQRGHRLCLRYHAVIAHSALLSAVRHISLLQAMCRQAA